MLVTGLGVTAALRGRPHHRADTIDPRPLHDLGWRGLTPTNGLTQRLDGHVVADPGAELEASHGGPSG